MRFPPVIDNTIRTCWAQCETKAKYQVFEEWGQAFSIHLHFGAAFAHAIEAGRKEFHLNGGTNETATCAALQAAIEFYGMHDEQVVKYKSRERLLEAVVSYFDTYNLEHDSVRPYVHEGKPAIEFSFAVPLPINNPETNEPLIYAGRADMLGLFQDTLYVVDEKTTSRLGPSWSKNWEHDSQFLGYTWASRMYGYPTVGALIRGVCMLSNRVEHIQVPYSYPDFLIERWYNQLLWDIQDMVVAWNSKRFRFAMHKGLSACSSCSYLNVCTSSQPEKVLETQFVQHRWDPLTRGEPLEG